MNITDLPFPVLDLLLSRYLDQNSCLKLRLLDRKHCSELQDLIFQKVILKRNKASRADSMNWLQFPYRRQNAGARVRDILRSLGCYTAVLPQPEPANEVGFRHHRESVELEQCCLGNKVLAMSNVQGTNQIFVLYTKSLRVYDTDVLARPHPACTYFRRWTGPPAVKGELLVSAEGSYVVVWRWSARDSRKCEATLLDVASGYGPLVQESNLARAGASRFPKSFVDVLETCSSATWISDFSLFIQDGSRPIVLHLCLEGNSFLKEELHQKKTDTILCNLLARATLLQSFPYCERDPDFLTFTLLAGGNCPAEKPGGSACHTHRLTIFRVKSLNVTELQNNFFRGSILDIKVTHSQAIIMVQHDRNDMDLSVERTCQGCEYNGSDGVGYLYFFQCTRQRWDPVFLFRSNRVAVLDMSRPIKHQWSLTEGKIVYRLRAERLVEVPLYWLKEQEKKKTKQIVIREDNESLALGSHGDIYSSRGSAINRTTRISLQREQRVRLLQSVVRV